MRKKAETKPFRTLRKHLASLGWKSSEIMRTVNLAKKKADHLSKIDLKKGHDK